MWFRILVETMIEESRPLTPMLHMVLNLFGAPVEITTDDIVSLTLKWNAFIPHMTSVIEPHRFDLRLQIIVLLLQLEVFTDQFSNLCHVTVQLVHIFRL